MVVVESRRSAREACPVGGVCVIGDSVSLLTPIMQRNLLAHRQSPFWSAPLASAVTILLKGSGPDSWSAF